MSNIIDHKKLAISRLASQFTESTNLIAYIRALLVEADTLESVFQDILNKRFIDTAEGIQLDILGAIVGQPREFIGADLFGYFGFAVNPVSGSFGTLLDISLGERFRITGESITGIRILTDTEYRLFIRARIIRNSTRSTPEDIIGQIKFLFQAEQIIFQDGDTQYSVSIGKILTSEEKSVLLNTDIVAKTAGVKVNYITNYNFNNFFSFQNIPNGLGLGSISNPSLGGTFGTLI